MKTALGLSESEAAKRSDQKCYNKENPSVFRQRWLFQFTESLKKRLKSEKTEYFGAAVRQS